MRDARAVARPSTISRPDRATPPPLRSRPSPDTAAFPTDPRSPDATLASAAARAGACAVAAGTGAAGATTAEAMSARVRRRIGLSLTKPRPAELASESMATAAPKRELPGEKAQRIVDAMRTSVGVRGATGSTFDHVAREAGVSRGLLHYYFGTKERLLAEVVRRDCDLRMERLSATAAGVADADGLLDALVASFTELLDEAPEFFVILFELHTVGARNEEIAGELTELHRRVRTHLAGIVAAARDAGAIRLEDEPEVVAEVLLSLGDGIAMRRLAEPERDFAATIAASVRAVRALVRPA